uniref:claudin-19 isoform X3 n=1 Tax=Ciona intestinalis TaxID=7719 RepID=UPI000180BAEF|nr:claudin-19 isoform X3 [Ciona intestinalis]|eukprot:XP_002128486.1 claudin-19 isoform X3 [Ciona intestinalis]
MYHQLCSFICAFTSTALIATTLTWNMWAVNGPTSSSVLGAAFAWRGIWADCMQAYGGQYHCEEMGSMFETAGYILAIRAMMCIALSLSVIGCFVTLIGMECSKLLDGNLSAKRNLMRISGVLFLVAGVLTLASVSWYTGVVVEDFFSVFTQDNMIIYEMGAALYLGFVSSALALLTAILCFCMPGPKPEDEDSPPYKYTPTGYTVREPYETKVQIPKSKDKYSEYV